MSPVRKEAYKRVNYTVTAANASRIGIARKNQKMSKSAVVRASLKMAFKTFTPLATVGAITLDRTAGVVETSFNLPPAMVKRLEDSAKGWRYSKEALLNALLEHAFERREARVANG